MNLQDVKAQYLYFFKKVFNKDTLISDKQIESFLSILEKEYGESIGEEWLFTYLLFQFSKYCEADTKLKTIQTSWIFSKKALEKYRGRHEESYYFCQLFKEKYNIKKDRVIKQEENFSRSEEYKEQERNRFKNSEGQILHCYEALLFDETSKTCSFCSNRNYCLKL